MIYLKGFLVLKINIVNEKDAFLFSDLLGDIKRLSELKGNWIDRTYYLEYENIVKRTIIDKSSDGISFTQRTSRQQ